MTIQNIKNISGIYKIVCNSTQDFYVGSAALIKNRWRVHIRQLENNCHGNIYMQRLWNKYGSSSFSFSLLEYCNRDNLILEEQKYIDNLEPTINMCRTAGSWLGKKHRPETIHKMKGRVVSEETKSKIRGIKRSQETRDKISASKIGKPGNRKGIKASENTIEKMRIANIGKRYSKETNAKKGRKAEESSCYGKGKAVVQYTTDEEYIKEFVSADQAAIALSLKFGGSNIRKCCNKEIPKAYGYKWKFKS